MKQPPPHSPMTPSFVASSPTVSVIAAASPTPPAKPARSGPLRPRRLSPTTMNPQLQPSSLHTSATAASLRRSSNQLPALRFVVADSHCPPQPQYYSCHHPQSQPYQHRRTDFQQQRHQQQQHSKRFPSSIHSSLHGRPCPSTPAVTLAPSDHPRILVTPRNPPATSTTISAIFVWSGSQPSFGDDQSPHDHDHDHDHDLDYDHQDHDQDHGTSRHQDEDETIYIVHRMSSDKPLSDTPTNPGSFPPYPGTQPFVVGDLHQPPHQHDEKLEEEEEEEEEGGDQNEDGEGISCDSFPRDPPHLEHPDNHPHLQPYDDHQDYNESITFSLQHDPPSSGALDGHSPLSNSGSSSSETTDVHTPISPNTNTPFSASEDPTTPFGSRADTTQFILHDSNLTNSNSPEADPSLSQAHHDPFAPASNFTAQDPGLVSSLGSSSVPPHNPDLNSNDLDNGKKLSSHARKSDNHEPPSNPDNATNSLYDSIRAYSSGPEDVARLRADASPHAIDAMKRTVLAIVGALPSEAYDVTITSDRSGLGNLMQSSFCTGYALRNAEYRMSLNDVFAVLGATGNGNFSSSSPLEEYPSSTSSASSSPDLTNGHHSPTSSSARRGRSQGPMGKKSPSNPSASSIPATTDPSSTEPDYMRSVPFRGKVDLSNLSGHVNWWDVDLESKQEMSARDYVSRLENENALLRDRLSATRSHDLHGGNRLLEFMRTLSADRILSLQQEISSQSGDAFRQLEKSILGDVDSTKIQATYSTSRDYMAQITYWCLLIGYTVRNIEKRSELQALLTSTEPLNDSSSPKVVPSSSQ